MRKWAENQLNFLDITIHRRDNKFETSFYHKPTFYDLGLRYDSFVPKSYKINLISCLIHRAYEISSNWTNFPTRYCLFKTIFSSNFNPQFLFDNVLNKLFELRLFCPNYMLCLFQNNPFSLLFPILKFLVIIVRNSCLTL